MIVKSINKSKNTKFQPITVVTTITIETEEELERLGKQVSYMFEDANVVQVSYGIIHSVWRTALNKKP